MFSSLFFLISALLIANMAPEVIGPYWPLTPVMGFLWGLGIYVLVVGLIAFQGRLKHRQTSLKLANVELLAFLLVFHFLLAGHLLLAEIPWVGNTRTFLAIFSLSLYFLGLLVFHFSGSKFGTVRSRFHDAMHHLRMLIPFAIPFLLLSLIFDFMPITPESWGSTWLDEIILTGLTLLFVVLIMVFMPFWIQKLWKCTPLQDTELKERLESLCTKADFRHAGIKIWTIMNSSPTAAIIGIIPRYRYIMFTRRILNTLTPEEVEAVLAHEIAHSKRYHLLMYPLIIFGMIVTASLLAPPISEMIEQHFDDHLAPLVLLIPYLVIMGIYFRLVFGYFSRLFERQADLYVVPLGLPPQHMIDALHQVGVASGNSHNQPSWHHYSLQQRIDFLEKAVHNHKLIQQHDQKVRVSFAIYCVLLLGGIALLFFN